MLAGKFDFEDDSESIDAVENLLESYFMQVDSAYDRLVSIGACGHSTCCTFVPYHLGVALIWVFAGLLASHALGPCMWSNCPGPCVSVCVCVCMRVCLGFWCLRHAVLLVLKAMEEVAGGILKVGLMWWAGGFETRIGQMLFGTGEGGLGKCLARLGKCANVQMVRFRNSR